MDDDNTSVDKTIRPTRDGYYWIRIRGHRPECQVALWLSQADAWNFISGATMAHADNVEILSRVKEPNPEPGVYLIRIHNPIKDFPDSSRPQIAAFRELGENSYWVLAFKEISYFEGKDCEWVEILRKLVSEEELV